MTTSATPNLSDTLAGFHDAIHRYVLTLVRNEAEAEDLTQETFLRAHIRENTLRDRDAARGWLYRIATNVCLDRLRQRRPELPITDDIAQEAKSPSPSPLEAAERHATAACVQRCLDLLSDSYRAVILLHDAHGLTAREIAQLLQTSLPTVKIRLHRARRRLEQVMATGCHVSQNTDGLPCCEPKAAISQEAAPRLSFRS
jgi:RNA polymerase sigma-70 factor (ECF subfamily)